LQDGAEARRNLFYTANPNDPGKRVVSDLLDEILQQQYVASVVFRILFDMGIPTGNAVPALCDWLEVTGWGNAPSISLADAAALDADRAVAKLSRYTETQEAA
ncbi:MAG: hypothetical protein KIT73_10275, partial [Burkholderiales bacterium]|nr:hypothetical protein [Burkholderiales bacterium]